MRVHICAVGRIRADQPERALFEDYHMRFNRTGKLLALGQMIEAEVEDKKGGEEVFLHAQKDLVEVAENDNTRTVKANQSFSVGGNQSFTVTGSCFPLELNAMGTIRQYGDLLWCWSKQHLQAMRVVASMDLPCGQ
jgi:hypothetical protein